LCLQGKTDQFSRGDSMRIGNTLRLLGWKRTKVWDRTLGNAVSGWKKPNINLDKLEIE
jgi:hypothetical protein